MNKSKFLFLASTFVMISCLVLCYKNYKYQKTVNSLTKDMEFYIDSLNRYVKLYPSTEFSRLKKENRELYNKVKEKENLITAIEFEWKYKYEGLEHKVNDLEKSDSVYCFIEQTDTVGYKLDIWATHIAKYKLDFNLTNKFILTHQQVDGSNRMEINSYLPGKIQDVTVWTKPQKKTHLGIGISLGAGYGLFTRKPDIFVGITGTYLIWTK